MSDGPDLAWLISDPAAVLVLGAALALVFLAALAPQTVLALLLVVLPLQPALAKAGLGGAARYADEALLVAVSAGLALRWWLAGSPAVRRTPYTLPIIAWCAVGLAGALVNQVPLVVAGLGTFALLKGILAAELFARVPWSRAWRARLAWNLGGIALLLVAVAVFQRLGGASAFDLTGQTESYASWAGTKVPSLLGNHNAFGQVMLVVIILALGQLWNRPEFVPGVAWPRWLIGGGSLGLLLSASRESWLAVAAALIAGARTRGSPRLLRLALGASVALAVAGGLVYASSDTLRAEWGRRSAGVAAGWYDYDLGFTGRTYRGEYRVYVLRKSWDIWLDHPWLGTGPGRFGGHVAVLFPSPVYADYAFQPQGVKEKPEPLDVFWSRLLTEWGLAGTAVYLAALAAAWRVFRRAMRLGEKRAIPAAPTSSPALSREGPGSGGFGGFDGVGGTTGLSGLGIAGVMLVAAYGVLGWFAPVFEEPLMALPFWSLAGLAASLLRQADAFEGN